MVRRVSPAVSTADWPRDVGHSPHEMLIPDNVMDACFTGVRIKVQFFGNGDVSGWRGKRNRPRWKTSTEWQRRETVANHAAGIAPSAPTRSLEFTRCGSSEKRENNRIHLGPRGRNGPLGANVVGERHALPRSCTTFSGGRAFTQPKAAHTLYIARSTAINSRRGDRRVQATEESPSSDDEKKERIDNSPASPWYNARSVAAPERRSRHSRTEPRGDSCDTP